MQMDRLPCALRIHGGPVASSTVPGGAINPLRTARGLIETAIDRGFHHQGVEGPQSRELGRRLRGLRIDTVLANYGPTAVALLPICSKLGIKLVVHFHGFDAHKTSTLLEHRDGYVQLGKYAAAVVAVSHRMKESLIKSGVPAERIHLLRYGVDPEKFPAKSDFPNSPTFFGVGRFVDKKAPYLTVLAFSKVQKQVPSARLVLAGDGPLLEATSNLANALGLGGSVTFPGILRPEEVANHMRNATAYVQHSVTPLLGPSAGDSEGTPVAILEALMTGLPVISTRHAGIFDVVRDEETGLLNDERDVEGMSVAMLRLASTPGLAAELGATARRDALQKYTATHYIEALHRLLVSFQVA